MGGIAQDDDNVRRNGDRVRRGQGLVVQPVLFGGYQDGFDHVPLSTANQLLVRWGHDLGPCRRPFASDCWTFNVDGEPIAVAISASTVSTTVAGYRRREVVELARLCSSTDWANRLMLRWWREVGARRWPCWTVTAAVSYSVRGKTGNLYRFDGWELVGENHGSAGGGTWSNTRPDGGKGKKLWLWRYADMDGARPLARPQAHERPEPPLRMSPA
jgi:hypothetical protein